MLLLLLAHLRRLRRELLLQLHLLRLRLRLLLRVVLLLLSVGAHCRDEEGEEKNAAGGW